jgi:hypothetical protein
VPAARLEVVAEVPRAAPVAEEPQAVPPAAVPELAGRLAAVVAPRST